MRRVAEPLIAGGVRCHGGFGSEGTVRARPGPGFGSRLSPPGAHENSEKFSTELLTVPLERWARSFPNMEQARFSSVGRPGAADGDPHPDRHRGRIRRQHSTAQTQEHAAAFRRRCTWLGDRPPGWRTSSKLTGAMRRGGTRRRVTRTCGSQPGTSPSNVQPRPRHRGHARPHGIRTGGPGGEPTRFFRTTFRQSSK